MTNPKIYFVQSSNEKPSKVIEESFNACRSNGIDTINCNNEEILNICKNRKSAKNKHIIVLDQFSGELFEQLKLLYCVSIVGPLCVLACLNDGFAIPNCDWPLYNVAMKGAVVCCSNLSKDIKARIKELVRSMYGVYTDACIETTTHLVTDSVISEKYATAIENNIKVMSPTWIEAIWSVSQNTIVEHTNEVFVKYKCPIFQKLRVCATGLGSDLNRKISEEIKKYGGKFTSAMRVGDTDILICHGNNLRSSAKYKSARANRNVGIRCVTVDWVSDSVSAGYALLTDDYAIRKKSTPIRQQRNVKPNETCDSVLNGISAIGADVSASVNVNVTVNANATVNATLEPSINIEEAINLEALKNAEPFLDGCNVYLICFKSDQVTFLHRALKYTGATRHDVYSDRVSHVIVGTDLAECGKVELRQLAARGHTNSHVVSVKWLIDCVKAQMPLGEDNYTVSMDTIPCNNPIVQGSPLSKKGIQLLRTDTSIVDPNSTLKFNEEEDTKKEGVLKPPQELQQYMQTEDDDTLEQYFAHVDTEDLAGISLLPNEWTKTNKIPTDNGTTIELPSTSVSRDKPSTSVSRDKPSTSVSRDKPSTSVSKSCDKPSTTVSHDNPSTSKLCDKPSTSRDKPSTSVSRDMPSTSESRDKPSTSRDKPSSSVSRDKPSTSKSCDNVKVSKRRVTRNKTANEGDTIESDEAEDDEDAPFHNKTFHLLTAPTSDAAHIITALGGRVVAQGRAYRGCADFAIIPLVSSEAVVRTLAAGALHNEVWLRQCKAEGRLVVEGRYWHRCVLVEGAEEGGEVEGVLEACVVTMSGLEHYEQNFLTQLIHRMGGKTQGMLSRVEKQGLYASTHLVAKSAQGKKYDGAIRWGVATVSYKWVLESLQAKRKLEEKDFPVEEAEQGVQETSVVTVAQKTTATPNKSHHSTSHMFETPTLRRKDIPGASPVTPRLKSIRKQMRLEMPKDTQSPLLSQACSQDNSDVSPSQMTPISRIVYETTQRIKYKVAHGLPDSDDDMSEEKPVTPVTPATPFSTRVLGPDNTKSERKALREYVAYIDTLPDDKPQTPSTARRLSTPMSELKRQYMVKLDEMYDKECEKLRKEKELKDALKAKDFVDEVFLPNPPESENQNAADMEVDNAETQNRPTTALPNRILEEKMRNLAEMLSSSSPSISKPPQPLIITPVPGLQNLPDSQTCSIGWDYDVGSTSTRMAPTNLFKPRLFLITGVLPPERDELCKKIKELDGKVVISEQGAKFDPNITHLLCAKVSRSEKTLCAIASGKWVLHLDYIAACLKAKRFLNEEPYEFGNPSCNIAVQEADLARAASCFYWRTTIAERGFKAFHDVKAIILEKDGRRAKDGGATINVLEAGGGTVVDSLPPYDNNVYATHLLTESKSDISDLIPLAKLGIYCVYNIYLHEFLVNRNFDIEKAVIPPLCKFYCKGK